MKFLKTVLLALLVIVAVAALCSVVLIRRGFRATATPSRWETALARTVRDLAIPGRESRQRNPYPPASDATEGGRELYLAQCASCHAID
jgi:hypothetical protein